MTETSSSLVAAKYMLDWMMCSPSALQKEGGGRPAGGRQVVKRGPICQEVDRLLGGGQVVRR